MVLLVKGSNAKEQTDTGKTVGMLAEDHGHRGLRPTPTVEDTIRQRRGSATTR